MLLLSLALFVAVLAMTGGLFAAGLRSGDRVGEVQLSRVEMDPNDHAVRFTLENPGDQAVLVGASLRPRSLRLRLESGSYVSVPRKTASSAWRPGRHAVIAALAPGERSAMLVPIPPGIGRRGELTLAIGEQRRLKVLHRAVEFADRRPNRRRRLASTAGTAVGALDQAPRAARTRPDLDRAPCE